MQTLYFIMRKSDGSYYAKSGWQICFNGKDEFEYTAEQHEACGTMLGDAMASIVYFSHDEAKERCQKLNDRYGPWSKYKVVEFNSSLE